MHATRLCCAAILSVGSLWACRSPSVPDGSPKPSESPPAAERSAADAGADAFETCLDRELTSAGLNRYGDPSGTMYAGGTPLFNEQTGKTISRKDYVAQKRPDLVKKCE
jgi:hypothetical protein